MDGAVTPIVRTRPEGPPAPSPPASRDAGVRDPLLSNGSPFRPRQGPLGIYATVNFNSLMAAKSVTSPPTRLVA